MLLLLLLALAADPPKGAAPKPQGAGGDNAKARTASMIIESEQPRRQLSAAE